MKNSKEIFLQLYKAETEEEILKILEENDMNKNEDWRAYGDQESNYSVIGNQASSAEKALVERITNSVDAILMEKCYERGIDPKSDNTPNTTVEAINSFFDLNFESKVNKNEKLIEKIGDSLAIYATSKNMATYKELGKHPHVNITIYDEGEGQTPENLPRTILSLLRGNKKGIKFTQGTYNQGGSGSLMYCGEKKFCLIISKRNINIPDKFNNPLDYSKDMWGWTLIREVLNGNERDPKFVYYAPDGKVPRFLASELPLKASVIKGEEAKKYLNYDKSCSAAIPYSKNTSCGTAIKLYNYSLRQKGPLVSHFKYEMGRGILDTYLPIRLVDCRKNKFNNETIFRGLNKLIEDDNGNANNPLVNERFPIINTFSMNYANKEQKVKMTIYGFNTTKDNAKSAKDILGTGEISPIRLVLGEQFQGELAKSYITNAKLGVIKDCLLIIIEFPNIVPEFKKDLFMTDRERLVDKLPKEKIVQNLKTFLNENEILKEFAQDKMKEILSQQNVETLDVVDAVKTWINEDPDIAELLKGHEIEHIKEKFNKVGNNGLGIPVPSAKTVNNQLVMEEVFSDLRDIPTFFIPMHSQKELKYILKVTKNKNFTLKFKTNAKVDFFDREHNPGIVSIKINDVEAEYSITSNPGEFKFYFPNKYTEKVTDLKLKFDLKTFNQEFSCTYDFEILVNEPILKEASKSEKNKKDMSLPEYRLVYKEKWEECDMNQYSGDVLYNLEDKELYCINMDNIYFLSKLSNLKTDSEKEYFTQLYKIYMLICGIVAKAEYKRIKRQDDAKYDSEYESVKEITSNASRMVFVMEKIITNINYRMQGR